MLSRSRVKLVLLSAVLHVLVPVLSVSMARAIVIAHIVLWDVCRTIFNRVVVLINVHVILWLVLLLLLAELSLHLCLLFSEVLHLLGNMLAL